MHGLLCGLAGVLVGGWVGFAGPRVVGEGWVACVPHFLLAERMPFYCSHDDGGVCMRGCTGELVDVENRWAGHGGWVWVGVGWWRWVARCGLVGGWAGGVPCGARQHPSPGVSQLASEPVAHVRSRHVRGMVGGWVVGGGCGCCGGGGGGWCFKGGWLI